MTRLRTRKTAEYKGKAAPRRGSMRRLCEMLLNAVAVQSVRPQMEAVSEFLAFAFAERHAGIA